MLKEERKRLILNEVRIHNRVLLTDMAETVKVSVDTIRRDVIELDKEQKLKRVHGGAISLGFYNGPVFEKEVYAIEDKINIAKKSIGLIKDGQVILLSGGTTNYELARLMPPHLKITCFTPSLPIAQQLLVKNNIEVILIGGMLSKDSQITIGGTAINMLTDIKVDICFLGSNSLHPDHGVTEFDWEIVEMKKAMIKSSKMVVSPTISEKIGNPKRFKICDIKDIDILITELPPEAPQLKAFRDKGIHLL